MAKKTVVEHGHGDASRFNIAEAILTFIGRVPHTQEERSGNPATRARAIASAAAAKAAWTAGSLALPPGPLGWLTILPELLAVWKLQAQMVADLAGVYGKTRFLTREQMIYCLFRHLAAQAVRDLVVRVGERFLVRHLSVHAFEAVVRKVGIRITHGAVARGVSRWLPVAGALGVGAYAYYDTGRVAQTAIDLFKHKIEIESATDNLVQAKPADSPAAP
jgi:hypothetical protein